MPVSCWISPFGAKLIVGSEMSTGQLDEPDLLCLTDFDEPDDAFHDFVMVTMSRASMERIVEILKERADITDGAQDCREVRDGSIRFEQVEFRYKKEAQSLFERNQPDIKSGQTVGILGGTGSGKSSLVQLIPPAV